MAFSDAAIRSLATWRKEEGAPEKAGLTMDEFRGVIRSQLLDQNEQIEIALACKGAGINDFDPRGGATRLLSEVLQPEEIPSSLAEIDSVLKAIPDKAKRWSCEFWLLAANLQVIRYIAKSHFDETPLPLFDSLAVGHVHAATKTVGGNHLLIFQSGTKVFTNLFTKALVGIWTQFPLILRALDDLREDQIIGALSGIDAIGELTKIIHGYLFLGFPGAGAHIQLDEGLRTWAGSVERGIDRFLVAHEYAHILLRHRSQDLDRAQRREQEIQADSYAIVFMLESMRGKDETYSMPYLGAHLIIWLQEMIMRTVYSIKKREFNRESLQGYPSAYERCINLMATCERKGILNQLMEQNAMAIPPILGTLYRLIIEPSLLETASRGRQLASIWS